MLGSCRHIQQTHSNLQATAPNPLKMQQMIAFFALVACVAAQPALLPTSVAPQVYSNLPDLAAPAPLSAISSSQRLDYFNQFNAAFAPQQAPTRLVATPLGLAVLPPFYGFPAANRFGQQPVRPSSLFI